MSRTVMLEWLSVAVLLLGCAVATAGVMAIVADAAVATILIVAGAVVAVVGAVAWTVVIKAAARRRHTA